jgi:O-succinylbenzoic acid--CoA ligase
MTDYIFKSIILNNKEVEIANILHGRAIARSPFEANVLKFIQKWFGLTKEFSQHTSGSTGIPKVINISREQMIASAKLTEKALKLNASDVALVCLDPEYIAGKMMLVRSFVTNMKIVAVTPSSNPFSELEPNCKIDFMAVVPLQLNEIVHSNTSFWLNQVKKIIVGGAEVSSDLQKKLAPFSSEIFATYGMTETISHIALQHLNGALRSERFSVLPEITINTDERGCLTIKAPFLPDIIHTNDLVEIQDSNSFKWLGRIDNIINSGGIKVIPENVEREISKIMEALGQKSDVMVTGIPDDRLGNKVVCLVKGLLDDGDIAKIKMDLSAILSPFEIPKEFVTNVNLISTANGKLNRSLTKKQFENLLSH